MATLRERLNNELDRVSLDHCVKCTLCEQNCPVAPVTDLFSGPKFVGPQAERFRNEFSVDHSIDYCSSCSTCTVVCPQGVNVAEINSIGRALMREETGIPLRDRLIVNTTMMGRMMTPVAPVANAVLNNKMARIAMEKVVGVHRAAAMPTARSRSFRSWWRKHTPARPATRGPVVFFHGCAGGYFEVETAKQAVEVLEHIGYEVLVPKQSCCGLAAQSNGLFDQASASVRTLVEQLRSAGEDLLIISTAGSCGGMLRHEAHKILGIDDPELADVGMRMRDISEFLMDLVDAGQFPVDELTEIAMRVPYHQPCQVRSQGMGMPAADLMRLIPGLEIVESFATCCGIAGTYGLKKEKYEIGQLVGKDLFDMVEATNQGYVACDTETCRWQIEKSTKVTAVHPVFFVHKALGLAGN